ncbi:MULTISPECIES: glutaminyl-peptide cyclotransferase [unclassified Myroides]|uniref:glutaminyl-peptide cyclotransferase n=1 Tax=unclassified Myroides TaxID=2642485 RepID=UPI0015F9D7BF|nr:MULTISPECIES: glutaminyl-peptide cyclotransferase [unclassified Myroides]MBB1149468.1 glutaminyl-peptide cyclotransferase [Myroides sp. NP-2]MDM1406623.1 glutaminyl-peptide cyclotransferase [Myroides sp. DF42-4-2]
MKRHNMLIPLALSLTIFSCSEKNNLQKNVISLNTSELKQVYNDKETIKLSLNLAPNTELDSVVYYLNDHRLGSSKANELVTAPLKGYKYGQYILKGTAYANKESIDVTTRVTLLSSVAPQLVNYSIVNTLPHDIKAYTQGLEFHNGILYESTGNGEGIGTGTKGVSSVRQINPKTGEVLKIKELPASIFGEGCTILNNKLYQLTYKNNEAYVYNPDTFEKIATLPYFQRMEGWGLCNDGTYLYMTDGSEKIYKLNPDTFEKVDEITVAAQREILVNINELEWVNGKIYANFYGKSGVAIINPTTGAVEGVIDLSQLYDMVEHHPDLDVLNGIAYNAKTNTFFVTGKNWNKMFEIKIIE